MLSNAALNKTDAGFGTAASFDISARSIENEARLHSEMHCSGS